MTRLCTGGRRCASEELPMRASNRRQFGRRRSGVGQADAPDGRDLRRVSGGRRCGHVVGDLRLWEIDESRNTMVDVAEGPNDSDVPLVGPILEFVVWCLASVGER